MIIVTHNFMFPPPVSDSICFQHQKTTLRVQSNKTQFSQDAIFIQAATFRGTALCITHITNKNNSPQTQLLLEGLNT